MTQKELLSLLGLPVTDQRIINFFAGRNLKPPQHIPKVKPNSTMPLGVKNNVGLKDPEWGFLYYFRSEVLHENFPLIQEGKNFVPYLTQIDFNINPRKKREGKEPDHFWNVSPPLDSSMEVIEKHFGKFDHDKKYPSIRLPFNEQVDIVVALTSDKDALSGYFTAIKESSELYHATDFEPKYNFRLNLILMLIKWLNDHHYLAAGQQPLTNDTENVLNFVQTALKNHLWENQLIPDEQVRKFMISPFNSKYGLENNFYSLLGQLEHYESLEWAEQKQWVASIPFNDETYATFFAAMCQSFEQYKNLNNHL